MCKGFLSREHQEAIASANSQYPVVSSRGFCMSLAGRRETKQSILREIDRLTVERFKL